MSAWGDHGNLDAASHVETLRTHPVLGFLFNQRGGLGPATVISEFDGNGQANNLQAMSASELYLASYARKPAPPRSLLRIEQLSSFPQTTLNLPRSQ